MTEDTFEIWEKGKIIELKDEWKDDPSEPKYIVISDNGNRVEVKPLGDQYYPFPPINVIPKSYFK